jgi:hypothetical protein
MRAKLTAAIFGAQLDYFLEYRTEDSWRDVRSLYVAAVQ